MEEEELKIGRLKIGGMLADFGMTDWQNDCFIWKNEGFACGTMFALLGGMSAASEALKARTEDFAVAVVKFCETVPNTIAGRRIAQQLIDASTSVAANYRAACRGYTRPIFVSKLAVVAEEADESELWLRILRRTGLRTPAAVSGLEQEAHELASIFTASLRTARTYHPRSRANPDNPPIS